MKHVQGSNKPAASTGPVGLTPSTITHAYGIDNVLLGSITGDGTGQIIAIVDAYNDPNVASDLVAFDAAFGIPAPPSFTVIGQDGTDHLPSTDPAGPGNSWALEISLDVQWAHVVAPKASIVLVEANSAANSDLYAAVDTARQYPGVSVVSMSWGTYEVSNESASDVHFTTPTGHIGVTFIAASGDNGAYITKNRTKTGLYPAVSKNVLSVGGTTLTTDNNGNYISESAWSGAGGGISGYIAQPSYQHGIVTQSSNKRTVPDVAMDADPNTGVAVCDSWDLGASTPWVQVGGTSLAAPLWAGVIAIANQGRVLSGQQTLDGPTQTLPKIYALPATDFHDVTTGSNGFSAGAGYDLITGRGTPIVNLLAIGLAEAPQSISTAVNPGQVQRFRIDALTVSFSQPVTVSAASLVLHNSTLGVDIDISSAAFSYNSQTQTATWNLHSVAIPDGVYTATLPASGAVNASGAHLMSNTTLTFFRLQGDINGDGRVGPADLASLIMNWYPAGTTMTGDEGDLTGDGAVGPADLSILIVHWNPTGLAGRSAAPLS